MDSHWMRALLIILAALGGFFIPDTGKAQLGVLGRSVLDWPTGVTVYKPEKCFNGYTIITPYRSDQAFLIDMAGRVVHTWYADPENHSEAWFFDLLPNGHWITMTQAPSGVSGKEPDPTAAGNSAVVELDWNGVVVWKYEAPEDLHFHHDMDRTEAGNTLILTSVKRRVPRISKNDITDMGIIEVTPDKQIVWRWSMADHFDELGFPESAVSGMYERGGDIFHTNTLEILPPNKLANSDSRFSVGNLLLSNRSNGLLCIVDRNTGKVVWTWGMNKGGLVGQHHPTMLHSGNILIYDNGGSHPYPAKNRDFTQLVEVAPLTGEVVWRYSHEPYIQKHTSKFFSSSWGGVQRLPNGNTLSLDCHKGRIFEITPQGEIVWEYISPFFWGRGASVVDSGIYRVYRYAYDKFPKADTYFMETDGHL